MTKRAIIVGLIMAVVALVVIFIVFSPDKTPAPIIYEQEPMNRNLNQTPNTDSSSDNTDNLDTELNSANTDLNGIDNNIDTTGL